MIYAVVMAAVLLTGALIGIAAGHVGGRRVAIAIPFGIVSATALAVADGVATQALSGPR